MLDKLASELKKSGNKLTKPRLSVFKCLQRHDQITIPEILSSISGVDRASVYRVLKLYRDLNIIQDAVSGGKRVIELTDQYDRHHHHMSCTKCGKNEIFEDKMLESRMNQLAGQWGYSQTSHRIELSGLCKNCSLLSEEVEAAL